MKCSICKEEGHNKRKCPEKTPVYKCHFCGEELGIEESIAYENRDKNYAIIESGKGYTADTVAPICDGCQGQWCWCSEELCPNPCPSCESTCDQDCGCEVDCAFCKKEGVVEFLRENLKWDSKSQQKKPVCEICQAGTS